MLWVIFQILKTVLFTGAVLAYAEIGPGGELLGNMIETTRDTIMTVDWSAWWSGVVEDLKGFVSHVVSYSGEVIEAGVSGSPQVKPE